MLLFVLIAIIIGAILSIQFAPSVVFKTMLVLAFTAVATSHASGHIPYTFLATVFIAWVAWIYTRGRRAQKENWTVKKSVFSK